jgi:hypothetical protein
MLRSDTKALPIKGRRTELRGTMSGWLKWRPRGREPRHDQLLRRLGILRSPARADARER